MCLIALTLAPLFVGDRNPHAVDRLQVEHNPDPPKPIRQVIPGLQQYEVKVITAEPDKPSPSHWLEFTMLVVALMLVVGYAIWRRARHEGTYWTP